MNFLNLEEFDYLEDVVQSRFTDVGDCPRLLDCFLHTYKITLVLVLAEHARFKLTHLLFKLCFRLGKCVSEESFLSH
jgi:hypothetical protein